MTSLGDPVADAALSPQQQVHPELRRRSLFTCGVGEVLDSSTPSTAPPRARTAPRKHKESDRQSRSGRTEGVAGGGPPRLRKMKSTERVSAKKDNAPNPSARPSPPKGPPAHTEPDPAPEATEPAFGMNSVVEVRYRGREQWWTGKIVMCRPDGTYDVQYGDLMERRVPAHYIRVRGIKWVVLAVIWCYYFHDYCYYHCYYNCFQLLSIYHSLLLVVVEVGTLF